MTHVRSVKKPWIVSFMNFTCASLIISKLTKTNQKDDRNVCYYSGVTCVIWAWSVYNFYNICSYLTTYILFAKACFNRRML